MVSNRRRQREYELRAMLNDPVGRLVLERKFFEATRSLAPPTDLGLLRAILAYEYALEADRHETRDG